LDRATLGVTGPRSGVDGLLDVLAEWIEPFARYRVQPE
jgi:hypothetical protein